MFTDLLIVNAPISHVKLRMVVHVKVAHVKVARSFKRCMPRTTRHQRTSFVRVRPRRGLAEGVFRAEATMVKTAMLEAAMLRRGSSRYTPSLLGSRRGPWQD